MTDQNDDKRLWRYLRTQMFIREDVTETEWQDLWVATEQTDKSIKWLIGDALVFGARKFPETWSQVVDAKYIHQQKGPMWVSSKIPPEWRRENVSWSAHRAAAALDEDDLKEALELAAAGDWTTTDMTDHVRSVKERKAAEAAAARRHNAGPPLEEEPPTTDVEPEPESGSTWNPDEAPPAPQAELRKASAPRPDVAAVQEAEAAADASVDPRVSLCRAAIASVRKIAPDLARSKLPMDIIARVSDQVAEAAEVDPALAEKTMLSGDENVIALVPQGWTGQIDFARDEFGVTWTVTLRRGEDQWAIGTSPSLRAAMIDAVLSAKISDMGAC